MFSNTKGLNFATLRKGPNSSILSDPNEGKSDSSYASGSVSSDSEKSKKKVEKGMKEEDFENLEKKDPSNMSLQKRK